MNELPSVSVIVPSFNSAVFLPKLIECVYNQTFTHYEIVIVDDGSTDATIEVISQYKDRIVFVRKDNEGPGIARNFGIARSKGKYIAFLDADDLWKPDKLEKQVDLFTKDPSLGMVFTRAVYRDQISGKILGSPPYDGLERDNIAKMLMTRGCFALTSSVMVRRDVLDETGGFDPSLTYSEDWDLFFRIAERYPVGFVNEMLTYHIVRQGSITSDESRRWLRIENEMAVLDKIYAHSTKYGKNESDKRRMRQSLVMNSAGRCFYDGNRSLCRKFCLNVLKLSPFNSQAIKLFLRSYIT